jgi:hypothetical protein
MKIGNGEPLNAKRVSDFFDNADDFMEHLDLADSNADTETQMQFVSDLREKFEQYGTQMFFSDKQNNWLKSLART